MHIKVYRAEQETDAVNGGWAPYAYAFDEDMFSDEQPSMAGTGCGVYGRCWFGEVDEKEVEVPDGSEVLETLAGDMALFVPGRERGYLADEVWHNRL